MFSPGSYQSEEVWPQLARSPYPPSPFCLGQASPLSSSPSQFLFAKQLTQICSISPPSAPGALCKPDQPNTQARIHRNVSKHARAVCFFVFVFSLFPSSPRHQHLYLTNGAPNAEGKKGRGRQPAPARTAPPNQVTASPRRSGFGAGGARGAAGFSSTVAVRPRGAKGPRL